MTTPLEFDNVFFESEWVAPFDDLHERDYIRDLLRALQKVMGTEFDAHQFIYYSSDGCRRPALPIVLTDPRPAVLIWGGDQSAVRPAYIPTVFKAVFKTHLDGDRAEDGYHHLPLGCTARVPERPSVPMSERSVDVFFSGNLNEGRLGLFCATHGLPAWTRPAIGRIHRSRFRSALLRWTPSVPSSWHVRFTAGFAQGLTGAAYADALQNSKLALCPPGFHRNETFRHYEAMRAGSIPVSLPLPDNRAYRGAPILTVSNWSHLRDAIRSELSDPDGLAQRQRAVLDWWSTMCSPTAVAAYMAECIRCAPEQS